MGDVGLVDDDLLGGGLELDVGDGLELQPTEGTPVGALEGVPEVAEEQGAATVDHSYFQQLPTIAIS